jgi:hypothetical protein
LVLKISTCPSHDPAFARLDGKIDTVTARSYIWADHLHPDHRPYRLLRHHTHDAMAAVIRQFDLYEIPKASNSMTNAGESFEYYSTLSSDDRPGGASCAVFTAST